MEEDLFANVRPHQHKIVEEYEGVQNLIKLVTHEIRPKENQKLFVIADGISDYDTIQKALTAIEEFLDDPVRKRFFFTTKAVLNIRIYIIEEIDT